MLSKNYIAKVFTTFFYLGKIKYCPGTFGSLSAFPLSYIIAHFVITNHLIFPFFGRNSYEQEFLSVFSIALLGCLLLFLLGAYCSSVYIQYIMQDDPAEIIIDEVVGQLLTIILCFFSVAIINNSKITAYLSPQIIDFIFLFALPFCLFRFFDIVKPWPINWFDHNIKGGLGIMLDDILAAIFASVSHYVITFFLIDWFG